jgi:hypothetical protein
MPIVELATWCSWSALSLDKSRAYEESERCAKTSASSISGNEDRGDGRLHVLHISGDERPNRTFSHTRPPRLCATKIRGLDDVDVRYRKFVRSPKRFLACSRTVFRPAGLMK